MPIPTNAFKFTQPMDPSDIVDFVATLSQGDTGVEMLSSGESVSTFTFAATAEAIAAGLVIKTTGGYTVTLVGLVLKFYLSIDPSLITSATFNGDGIPLAMELTITTNATPPRIRQKTLVVQVANQ